MVVCTSVMSLLSNLESMNSLLSEFHRVLKPSGRIYIDINGVESEFAYFAKNLGNSQYEYCGRDGKSDPIKAFCPRSEEDFSKFCRYSILCSAIRFKSASIIQLSRARVHCYC